MNGDIDSGLSLGDIRINRSGHLLTCNILGSAGFSKHNFGLRPQCQLTFNTVYPAFNAPKPPPPLIYQEIRPCASTTWQGLFLGLALRIAMSVSAIRKPRICWRPSRPLS